MNKCIIIGRLVRDIELKTLGQNGTPVVNNAIAVSRFRQGQNGEKIEDTLFLEVTFFNRYAEVVNQYLKKGSKLAAEGYLHQQNWIDNNGQNRSKIVLIVESMQMLDNKQDDNNNQQTNNYKQNNNQANNYRQSNNNQANNYKQSSNKYQTSNYYTNNESDEYVPF